MKSEVSVSFEGDHIQVVSRGEKPFEFATEVWTKTMSSCREHGCFKVLGIADSTQPPDTMDGYEHGRLFRDLGVTAEYRIAWVEQNPDAFDAIYFIETVLINRGFDVRLFRDVADARDWLLQEDGESPHTPVPDA